MHYCVNCGQAIYIHVDPKIALQALVSVFFLFLEKISKAYMEWAPTNPKVHTVDVYLASTSAVCMSVRISRDYWRNICVNI